MKYRLKVPAPGTGHASGALIAATRRNGGDAPAPSAARPLFEDVAAETFIHYSTHLKSRAFAVDRGYSLSTAPGPGLPLHHFRVFVRRRFQAIATDVSENNAAPLHSSMSKISQSGRR